MATLEERLACLEGRVEEHTHGMAEFHDGVSRLDHRMETLDGKVDRFREELASRIDSLDVKVDRFRNELSDRIESLDVKVDRFREELASRIDGLDVKVDRFREELAGRLDGLDQKVSRQFVWIVGMQLSVLLAVIGALLSR